MEGKRITSADRVLHLLNSSQGSFVSGEELASELGISRTAVWKAVSNLRSRGYEVEAVTNRGYRLSEANDILSEDGIRSYLSESAGSGEAVDVSSIVLDVMDTVSSTNTVCLHRASLGEKNPYAAIAGCQTQGRGRRGRSFFSPDGTGLYMSILLRPPGVNAGVAVRYTTIAAVAAAEAIESITGRHADIKWVNDIYMDGRKVCGILTEASFNPETSDLDYAVVGIGINVYEPRDGFPEEIRDIAGAIAGSSARDDQTRELIRRGGRNRLAADILSGFFRYLGAEDQRPGQSAAMQHGSACRYVQEYRKRCFVIGTDVCVLNTGKAPRRAHVLGVDDECRLIVRYEDGTEETLSSGEISISLEKDKRYIINEHC